MKSAPGSNDIRYRSVKGGFPRKKTHVAPRTWLLHCLVDAGTVMHYMVVATSIDDAWKLAMELPRKDGIAPRLGGIVDAGHWPSFMKVKLREYCNCCTRRSVLLTPREEHKWEEMANAYEAGWKEVIQ